ncbi:unnamed protein product [Lactuca saligna]|uniref:Beta-lactamase-related domain-containing protein n=1 Tax=Lactuca saligna TaxID=75948 RepID=A0AA35Z360_LACSI|nr:unnamed protein product [Lactuca saligna]
MRRPNFVRPERISYLNTISAFPESVHKANMNNATSTDTKWLCETPIHSDVEAKLRELLIELGNADKILGIQVCAYKEGKVIIDTAAGVMGKDDPRPVQPNTLFPVFSTTKGVTAGMIHWLADKGKLKLDEYVANIWPEFGTNGKDEIKVNHILNHTSGLHNALAGISENDPALFCDWDECVKRIAMVTPETEPGCEQLYHYFSYGWLCGGIIERVSGKKFQDVLEEAFVRPLNVEGELYIGIPHGVESRLATLTFDTNEFNTFAALLANTEFRIASATPSSLTAELIEDLILLSNTLDVRRAILPAANGHFTARALDRYYVALMDSGTIPTRHSSSSLPPLGSHPHHPTSPSNNQKYKTNNASDEINTKIFNTRQSKLHDAFLGLGGSTGYCDINNRFSIAVTVNKMSFMNLPTSEIIRFVCSKLDLPIPEDHA